MFPGPVRLGQTVLLQRSAVPAQRQVMMPQAAVRFEGTEPTATKKLEESDATLFNRLPRPVQFWLKKGLTTRFDASKPMPALGFEHLMRGMFRIAAQGAAQITDFDEDTWPCKPIETATLQPLMRYLHDGEEMEDEIARREVVWEVMSTSASSVKEMVLTTQAKNPFGDADPGIRFTPELRAFVEHFNLKAASLIPTTEQFFNLLMAKPGKKAKLVDSEGLKYFQGAMAAIQSHYQEVASAVPASRVTRDEDDEDEVEEAGKSEGGEAAAKASDELDGEDLLALAKAPYGKHYIRWHDKLRDLKRLPETQRPIGPRQLEQLEDVLKAFRATMPEEMGETVAESFSMQLTHAEALLDLPWENPPVKPIDLKKIQSTLDKDHFGMDEPKTRILKYMAVEQRRQEKGLSPQGKIMLLLGDPGVGKTSLAGSIAKATERPFASIALGGIKDVAEVRGDRRVYLQARPGIFMRTIRDAGVKNPVVLLDEIEKIQDRGVKDALLEVLDPKQQKTFRDYFVGEYDLSQVTFIATANSLAGIPAPLMRRLEIIPLRPYTMDEKLNIATKHLIPKVLENNVLTEAELQIPEATLKEIIDKYAPESGVAELERKINQLAESRGLELSQGKKPSPVITPDLLPRYLKGAPRIYRVQSPRVGRVNALDGSGAGALTPLDVTVHRSDLGKKRPSMLKLGSRTGGLGRMERESVDKALNYVECYATDIQKALKLENPLIKPGEVIRVNVDDGGEFACGPTDGPSAGITFTTGLVSALSGLPVRGDVAMTGTTSLHGDVGAIGGLLNKLMGAARSGAKTILVPRDNLSDDGKFVVEGSDQTPIPPELLAKLEIIPVQHFNEAISHLFAKPDSSR